MAKLCLKCYEVYEENGVTTKIGSKGNEYYKCPKLSCSGSVVNVDELLLPTIIILNKKGYYTESSCSGHLYESSFPTTYILFNQNIELPNIPNGYEIRENGCGNVEIYKDIAKQNNTWYFKSKDEIFSLIFENSKDLLKWAQELPIHNCRWCDHKSHDNCEFCMKDIDA